MARILISAAGGFIGSALVERLAADGHDVTRLVRRPPQSADEIEWDPAAGELDPVAVEGFDAVVHFSGAGIGDRRWTEERKRVLVDSRIDSTTLLAETLAGLERKPEVLISASAIGYYGLLGGDEFLTEATGPGSDFLARLCVDWEAATAPATDAGIRVAIIRSGLVLDDDQGFLAKMLPLFKLGVGGPLGSGKQWWSWIAKEDEIGGIVHLLDADVSGPVNLTAPNPVTNAGFTKILAGVLGRPARIPVPRFALAVRLGPEMADATALASQRVQPQQLHVHGYQFAYPELEPALRATLGL
jgi:uncharacterized protein (TIGR01777 family)